jgi:hypothetical protein
VTASASLPEEAASQAVDGIITMPGDMNSKWCAANSGAKWLAVDLGKEMSIGRWAVWHAEAGGEASTYNTRSFKLQASSDNTFWNDIDVVEANDRCMTNREVLPFTSRYVRLYVSQAEQNSNDATRIYEFAVYKPQEGQTRTLMPALAPATIAKEAILSQTPSRHWGLTLPISGDYEIAQLDLSGRTLSKINSKGNTHLQLPSTGCGIRIVLMRQASQSWRQVGKIFSSPIGE